MPEPDPFDELAELFAEDDLKPAGPGGYVPTRKEPTLPPGSGRLAPPRVATRVESAVPTKSPTTPTADDSQPFKPSRRPPLAMICVQDDGSDNGEWTRIRGEKCVIGRTVGDVRVPFDPQIADPHAEICRTLEAGQWRWHLTDLKSPFGSFVKVPERPLKTGTELILGSRRYRFDCPVDVAGARLIEIRPDGDGAAYVLRGLDSWFGREPSFGGPAATDDLALARRHCRFVADNQGNWKVICGGGRNGVWVRTERVRFPLTCRFQLGEQRFFVKVLT